MKLQRIRAILVKEVRQLRRDRLSLGMIVGIPLIQLLLFGYAINLSPRGLHAGIVDEARTQVSRAIVQDLVATQVIELVLRAREPQALQDAMRRGEISVGIVIPPDLETRMAERGTATRGLPARPLMQVIVDGSDTVVQSAALQLAQYPGPRMAITNDIRSASSGPLISTLPLYNPERRSAVNIVPGLVGVILTMTMVLFTSVAIVRERERGNMEMLIATPMSRSELMIGKVLPYALIGLVQVTLVLAVGRWLFQVPMRGSWLDTYLASLLLILANLALGLLISTKAKTQFQAMQMSFFVFLPSVLLSGFMFPYVGMPRFARWIAELLPLTHFLRLVRGIMLRGASIVELPGSILALAAFTVVAMTLAILLFRRRLD